MRVKIGIFALCAIFLTGCTICRQTTRMNSIDSVPKTDVQDRDMDGISDAKDGCPDVAENFNGYNDDDGCPDVLPAKITLRNINFGLNSTDIVNESKESLASAADILVRNPLLRVRIEGHTDSYGKPEYNVHLSKQRAEAVKTWLVQKYGIDSSRIETAGFGSQRPVASLNTREGRNSNRRIEFIILEAKSGKN